ncbi:GH92 family glycosyl hydrolase [Zhouia sp. PK063]|uniref:GH92 family glycosyl hydrolase n=1 Tax=Zhouia sp. PK063 TaxID=3373602 RepID=UPI003791CDAE
MNQNKIFGICTLLMSIFIFTTTKAQNHLINYVNPFIGTGPVNGKSLSGNNYPGATVPFGMIQLSPDTQDVPNWNAASGYNYNDDKIYGFSHTHLSGTGVAELFDVLLLPFTGNVDIENTYTSHFSHDEEAAKPGYYQVKLADSDIKAELTASAHVGFHRYTFSTNEKKHLVFDLHHSINDWGRKIIASQLRFVNNHTLEGYRIITGWAPMRKVYFHVEFSQSIVHSIVKEDGMLFNDTEFINGNDIKAILDFEGDSQLMIKVGLSSVSTQNAKLNMETEIPDWDFDKTVQNAEKKWEHELSKIKIEGTSKQKEIFYTALYHTLLQPNNIADVDGSYIAPDYTTKKAKSKSYYSTFSLWDTYRGAHPLYTILQPEKTTQFVLSMINYYKVFGYLPIWQLWGQENYCMIGNHAIPVIVDAVLKKNISGLDINEAYEAVKKSSEIDHRNSPFSMWEKYHYFPENLQSQSVSLTLEMAFDDWCVAQLAKKLNKTEDYEHFMKRSMFYKNLYDTKTKFFRSKDDKGNWIEPFDPLKYGANGGNPFTEGNAWQYFWYVPHDVNGLINLVGGKKEFISKLDTFFTLSSHPNAVNGNASGFIGQYAHGNEPSHHIAYLYNYAGEAWKTQFYVNKILKEMYTTSSSGYAGNEDCGEMSAWYIFSALGFYPVNPDNQIYNIGSPLLKSASLQVGNGKVFQVFTKNVSDENIYIQKIKLNGKNYHKDYITHNDIISGGIIEFVMGKKPNKSWIKHE